MCVELLLSRSLLTIVGHGTESDLDGEDFCVVVVVVVVVDSGVDVGIASSQAALILLSGVVFLQGCGVEGKGISSSDISMEAAGEGGKKQVSFTLPTLSMSIDGSRSREGAILDVDGETSGKTLSFKEGSRWSRRGHLAFLSEVDGVISGEPRVDSTPTRMDEFRLCVVAGENVSSGSLPISTSSTRSAPFSSSSSSTSRSNRSCMMKILLLISGSAAKDLFSSLVSNVPRLRVLSGFCVGIVATCCRIVDASTSENSLEDEDEEEEEEELEGRGFNL